MTTAETPVSQEGILIAGLRHSAESLKAEAAAAAEENARALAVYKPVRDAHERATFLAGRVVSALEMWDNGGPLHWQTVAGSLRRVGYTMQSGARDSLTFTARDGGRYAVQINVYAPERGRPSWRVDAKDAAWPAWRESIAAARRDVAGTLERLGYAVAGLEGTGALIVTRGPEMAAEARAKAGITVESVMARANGTKVE